MSPDDYLKKYSDAHEGIRNSLIPFIFGAGALAQQIGVSIGTWTFNPWAFIPAICICAFALWMRHYFKTELKRMVK